MPPSKVPSIPVSPHRDMSVPTIMDELVLYTEPEAEEGDTKPPGLGSVQPRGRAQVMQHWLRPEPHAQASEAGRQSRRSEPPRPLLLRPSAQAAAVAADSASGELEWSSLSDPAKQAVGKWVAGQLGGRHCMLVLEQGAGSDAAMPQDMEPPEMSDIKGSAVLNVLSGLFAEVGLLDTRGSGSPLFQEVFSKPAQQVLEEAFQACLEEIGDPRLERSVDMSPEQVNLALRRMAMKAQFHSCSSSSSGRRERSEASNSHGDECTKLQVWMELVRLQVEGGPAAGAGGAAPGASKDRSAAPSRPPAEKAFGDSGVLKELGKLESELEAESNLMSLEALRAQNRFIEEYVMRLVRQRDELKQVAKLAEERDSYYILGLTGPSASDDEVKKAYRNLARKEHPDKAGIGNKRRFQAIQQAYDSILKQREIGGSATVVAEEGATDNSSPKAASALLQESFKYAEEARDAADRVAICAHHALRSWEDGAEGQPGAKRRALRSLRELTRQSASELKGAAQQLRTLGHAISALVSCSEAFMSENAEVSQSNSGMALRDRSAIVEDAGRSCSGSAELLDRISEATEATLKKVEKASPDQHAEGGGMPPRASSRNDEAGNLLRLGVRLLTESLARTAAVARRTADEAISGAVKALDLHRGLLMLDAEARKELERKNRKRSSFDEDDGPVAAGDVERERAQGETKKEDEGAKKDEPPARTPRSRPETPQEKENPQDQLKSAARRVKDRHVSLRVKNLRFMASLNEEALRVQAKLWALLERTEGALLPEVTVGQKKVLFDLIAQLLESALTETARLASNLSVPPAKILERSLSFALALEHGKEIAVPVDSRTQALKLASLIDNDLLCQVLGGPFRRRLLAIGAKKRGLESFGSGGGYVPANHGRARGSSGIGVGNGANVKAWEEAASICCERVSRCVREALSRSEQAAER